MSVIIKGMEIPEDCRECTMCGYECDIGRTRCIIECRILAEHYKTIPFDGRPDWCPLVELPPHGRLIDAKQFAEDISTAKLYRLTGQRDSANAFINDGGNISTEWWCVENMIDNAPTVLEEEES